MAKCPYTWFVGLFGKTPARPGQEAQHLRVTVDKNRERVVDVALPAGSARWLIDLIPSDVVSKIREEGIPIDSIRQELAERKQLFPQSVFTLRESHRTVDVWLE
jgi:hypothetical protein